MMMYWTLCSRLIYALINEQEDKERLTCRQTGHQVFLVHPLFDYTNLASQPYGNFPF